MKYYIRLGEHPILRRMDIKTNNIEILTAENQWIDSMLIQASLDYMLAEGILKEISEEEAKEKFPQAFGSQQN